MFYCNVCGRELEDNEDRCPVCGAMFAGVDKDKLQTKWYEDDNYEDPAPENYELEEDPEEDVPVEPVPEREPEPWEVDKDYYKKKPDDEKTRKKRKRIITAVTIVLTLADQVSAGANGAFTYQMEYAMANPKDDSYETGTLGLEFIENVEVYEKYISEDALSDVETQVEEVTKEKETNKIYVVESGDVLSVIAMDHDTTVANIMALNGFDNAEVRIYPGQEIIIAVPEPDLSLRIKKGEVYEEDYNAEPTIIKNDEWYTTKQVVHQEGTTGHRERNDIVTYENGIEVARELAHQTIMVESTPAIIEQGTITPPTYIKPLAGGHFTSGFGRRWGRMHKGVDWGCPVGTTVYASSAGTVVSAGYSKGYGNNVVISHPDGRMTRYAHNSKLLVSAGQWVEQGQSIALSGSTGRSTGPHVHFEIYINGVAVNPLNYIGQ